MNGDYRIVPFEERHQAQVVELLVRAFPHSPFAAGTTDYFEWKHKANPFGRSYMWVAERDGTVVGFRSFMPWLLLLNGQQIRAARPVDAVTHPDHQRRGIFSALTRAVLDSVRTEVELIFNTPNALSLPGLLRMGWISAGEVAVRAWRKVPVPSVRPLATAWEGLGHIGEWNSTELLALQTRSTDQISTHLTPGFLRWRFSPPLLDYRVIPRYRSDGALGALVVARRRRGQDGRTALVVSRVLLGAGGVAMARSALREALRVSGCVKAFASEPPRSPSRTAAPLAGFLWRRPGAVLVAKPLADVGFDVRNPDLWGFGYLESEVF